MPNRPIDATMLASYAKCPRDYYYRHALHWSPRENVQNPRIFFGTAWHAAMDVIWPMLIAGDPIEQVWEAGRKSIEADWAMAALHAVVFLPPYDRDNALRLLRAYIEKLQTTSTILQGGRLLGIELPFVVPIIVDGETYDYCGVIDKVIESANGQIIPIDHKTTAKYATIGGFRADFRDSWGPRGQFIGYAYACSMLYGKRVPFVLVDAQLVHKTAFHQEFMPVTVTATEIAEWMDDVTHTIVRIRRAEATMQYEKLGPLSGACHEPYPCAYKPLCHGDFAWKTGTIPASLYEESKWAPVGGKDAI